MVLQGSRSAESFGMEMPVKQAKIKNKNKSKASGQVSILLTSRMTISRSLKVLVAGGI